MFFISSDTCSGANRAISSNVFRRMLEEKEPKLDRANSTENIIPEEENWKECYFTYS